MKPRRESPGGLPDPLRKREILYSPDTPAEEMAALGKAFMEQGFLMDALDCFAEARSRPELEGLLERALEEGDLFLLERCAGALGRKPSEAERRAVAARARELGKEAFAVRAERAPKSAGGPQED